MKNKILSLKYNRLAYLQRFKKMKKEEEENVYNR